MSLHFELRFSELQSGAFRLTDRQMYSSCFQPRKLDDKRCNKPKFSSMCTECKIFIYKMCSAASFN